MSSRASSEAPYHHAVAASGIATTSGNVGSPSAVQASQSLAPSPSSSINNGVDGNNRIAKEPRAKGRFTCDACKLRKVRCIQEGESCVQCSRHGIPCTFTPHVRKKMEPRAGKRIVLASTRGTVVDAGPKEHGTSSLNNSATSTAMSLQQLGKDGQPLSLVARRLQNAVAARVANAMAKDSSPSNGSYPQPVAVPFSSVVAAQRAEASASYAAKEAARDAAREQARQNDGPMVRYSGDALADQQLSIALITHLIELFKATPRYWLGLFSLPVLSTQVQAVNGRLYELPMTTQVLARSVIALTACISSHPLLFPVTPSTSYYHPNPTRIPSFDQINKDIPSLFGQSDFREFGKRRQHACDKLRQQAIDLAGEYGTLVEGGRENSASCHLLAGLVGAASPSPLAGKPYSVAHITHLREMCVDGIPDPEMEWSFLILLESLNSLGSSTISGFEDTDELLLCGSVPSPLIECARTAPTEPSPDAFDQHLYPFLYHATHLARKCVREISGTYAKSLALDEARIEAYLSDLEALFVLRSALDVSAHMVLGDNTMMHVPDGNSQVEVIAAIRFLVTVAWSSLVLPLLLELHRRLELLDQPELSNGTSSTTANDRSGPERLLQGVYRRVGVRAGALLAERVRHVPSLAWLTPEIVPLRLAEWSNLLIKLPAAPGEALLGTEAGGSLSVGEKAEKLEWLLDGMRLSGWSKVDANVDEVILDLEQFLIGNIRPLKKREPHVEPEIELEPQPEPEVQVDPREENGEEEARPEVEQVPYGNGNGNGQGEPVVAGEEDNGSMMVGVQQEYEEYDEDDDNDEVMYQDDGGEYRGR